MGLPIHQINCSLDSFFPNAQQSSQENVPDGMGRDTQLANQHGRQAYIFKAPPDFSHLLQITQINCSLARPFCPNAFAQGNVPDAILKELTKHITSWELSNRS